MPTTNSIASHRICVGITRGTLNKIILKYAFKGPFGDFGTAYPNVEPSTHCEAKNVREWRMCARFPIARRAVTAARSQRRAVAETRGGKQAHR